ncbi:hypothetical protein [Carboxylicivirga sp. RSCT41]|uniref:hypothetical protein n=1 Tax=Carboxylicivirga agarovorans TaxID=3417570 RepID=UPI003D3598B0
MVTKIFKTIEEFAKSNPSQETVERVLNYINRSQISKARLELRERNIELNRLMGLGKKMKESGLKLGDDYKSKVNSIKAEIKKLTAIIPPKKEKKEESKEEEK